MLWQARSQAPGAQVVGDTHLLSRELPVFTDVCASPLVSPAYWASASYPLGSSVWPKYMACCLV